MFSRHAVAPEARFRQEPDTGFREEVQKFVVEPDARLWMLDSINTPAVNSTYWAEWTRSFILTPEIYHARLSRDAKRAALLSVWLLFKRTEGAFAQTPVIRWPSIYGTVYAIRWMRLLLPPAKAAVPTALLLGDDVVLACARFISNLWRDGTFANGRRPGVDSERSITKLYYAVSLVRLLEHDIFDDEMWASILNYLRACMRKDGDMIGFEYHGDAKDGGWACTTYYAILLLGQFSALRKVKGEDFKERIETGLGVTADDLAKGVAAFMRACWDPDAGCRLSPRHGTGIASLNHTYMYLRVMDELPGLLGGCQSALYEEYPDMPRLLTQSESRDGGYALTQSGTASLASTYVAMRLWLREGIQGRTGAIPPEMAERTLRFVDRCKLGDQPGQMDYLLIPPR